MRSKIILITILVCIIFLVIVMLYGINIGNLEILSISQIKEKNNNLDSKIDKASHLTSIDYPNNVQTLEKSFEDYTIQKQKYEELTGSSIAKKEELYETKKYDISYLWRVLGKNAKNRNLTLGMDVQTINNAKSIYDLNFTISGQYVNIIQFITDIENDSDLYFRIYNFKMSGTTTVTATFTVKNINIDADTIKSTQPSSIDLSSQLD